MSSGWHSHTIPFFPLPSSLWIPRALLYEGLSIIPFQATLFMLFWGLLWSEASIFRSSESKMPRGPRSSKFNHHWMGRAPISEETLRVRVRRNWPGSTQPTSLNLRTWDAMWVRGISPQECVRGSSPQACLHYLKLWDLNSNTKEENYIPVSRGYSATWHFSPSRS